MRRELDREAHVRAAMQAVEEALDGRASDELEVLEPASSLGSTSSPSRGSDRGGSSVLTRPGRIRSRRADLRSGTVPGTVRWDPAHGLAPDRRPCGRPVAPIVGMALWLSLAPRRLDDPLDQLIHVHALGPGVEIEHEPVPQDGHGHRPDVGEIDVELPGQDRSGLGSEHQVLRGPGLAP